MLKIGIVFAFLRRLLNHLPMYSDLSGKDLSLLLDLYNREVEVLKSRLLNGDSWEQLSNTRKLITELAIAIHKSHGHLVPDYMGENPETLQK